MPFDLPDAAPPELLPLVGSFEPGDYRDALKRLTLDLFAEHLGADAFDTNVLGIAHLGSFDLVRRFVQADGLGMLRSDREAAATRYLYRAWKKADGQGRGLHFLRTYLQLLFPGGWSVDQLEHEKDTEYPLFTRPRETSDSSETHYLTSRIQVMVDARAKQAEQIATFAPTISACLPARFVPEFGVMLNAQLPTVAGLSLSGFCKSLNEPLFRRSATLPTLAGLGLGAFGRNQAEPKLERNCAVPARTGAVLFGHLRDRRRRVVAQKTGDHELLMVRKPGASGWESFTVRKPDHSGFESFQVRANG